MISSDSNKSDLLNKLFDANNTSEKTENNENNCNKTITLVNNKNNNSSISQIIKKESLINLISSQQNNTSLYKMCPNFFHSTLFLFLAMWLIVIFLFNSNLYLADNTVYYKEIAPLFDLADNVSKYCTNQSILDLYDGNLRTFYNVIERSQITFVYLYAHWCARSLAYKELTQKLACKYSSDDTLFLAINCFNKDGECKKNFNYVKFPNLITHIRDIGFFSYTGPVELEYLSNYLEYLQKPITIIDNFDGFLNFVLFNDGALVANFNFSSEREKRWYKTYYQSALTTLHHDMENPIKYAIVLDGKLWKQLLEFETHVKQSAKRKLKIVAFSSFGYQSSFKNMSNLTVDSLTKWAFKHVKQSIRWYYSEKMKNSPDLSKLLIFLPRDLSKSKTENYEKNYAIAKYLFLKNRIDSIQIKKNQKILSFYMKYLESNYLNDASTCVNDLVYFNSFAYDLLIRTNKQHDLNLLSTCPLEFNQNEKTIFYINKNNFLSNTALMLVDSNLYSNYALNVIHGWSHQTQTSLNDPTVLLIDYKNESTFLFNEKYSYTNLEIFIKNQTYSANQRHMKSDSSNFSSRAKLIQEINAKKLSSILNFNSHEYSDKDVLIYYYNNWCGFCKILQYNLLVLMNDYMKNVDSFQIVKINVDKNDLAWHFQVQQVPTLLFLPSGKFLSKRDPILYNPNAKFELENLLEFILYNAKNPLTLSKFLVENLANRKVKEYETSVDLTKASKLRMDLIQAITNKLDRSEMEANRVSRKIESKTKLDINSSKLSDFSRQIDVYLNNTLDRHLTEMNVLRTFLQSFKRNSKK